MGLFDLYKAQAYANGRADAGSIGYLEPLVTLGSGAVAEPVAGLGGLMTGDVGVINALRDAMTYQPRTSQGQAGMNTIANALQSAKTTMVDENPPVNALVNALGQATDYVGERSPAAGAAMKAAPLAALALLGPGSSVTRQAFGNVGRGTVQGGNRLAQLAYQNAGVAPTMRGPLAAQGGAVKLGGMPNKELSSLSDVRKLLQESKEPVYVRWSAGVEHDMKPGAVSRDYASGSSHGGLSAVPLSNDMTDAQLAKFIDEYRFLRMKNPDLRPHIYAGRAVGVDSDSYPSITPSSHLGTLSESLLGDLQNNLARKLELADSINRASSILQSGKGDAIGRQIVKEKLDSALQELEKLNTTR